MRKFQPVTCGALPRQLMRMAVVLGLITLPAFGPRPAAADEAAPTDSCVACHSVLPEPLNVPVEGMKHDVHGEKGLSCVDCHGGDATVADQTSMAP